MFDLQEELKKLPAKPGVYIMHDKSDEIIYVGKAISLKNRVRQYFQSPKRHSEKIRKMVSHIDHFEYIITDSEVEALVLECNLIKEHRPHYNTMLKDDKSYPYIKVTVGEDFPRVFSTHQMKRDKARYFGPYTSAIKETLELLHKVYKIRTCNRRLPEDCGKDRPCLNYQIGNCPAPCTGNVPKEEYQANIDKAIDFLSGNYGPIKQLLTQRMQAAAAEMKFEDAAGYRDMIAEVEKMSVKQKINDNDRPEDRDVIALARSGDEGVVQVFFVREGKLMGREHFHLTGIDGEEHAEIVGNFIKQYYCGTPFLPKELLVEELPADTTVIEEWLSERRGNKVSLRVPVRGEKARLLDLAHKNALLVLNQDTEKIKRETERTMGAVHEMEELLGLSGLHRMESFDISNISGFENVGSMVVYEDGKPKKNDYRKFKIKGVVGQDDYASMEEVLTRRFTHGLREQKAMEESGLAASSFSSFPDILLMDGGKGQVNVALAVLDSLKLDIPVAGLVKDDNHRTRGIYYNNVEMPINTAGEMFKLITRIQDETHRFAIEYHKSLRSKSQVHSILDDIPLVGEKRRRALMKAFVSLDAIKAASVEELAQTESMDMRAAEAVYAFFHGKNDQAVTD